MGQPLRSDVRAWRPRHNKFVLFGRWGRPHEVGMCWPMDPGNANTRLRICGILCLQSPGGYGIHEKRMHNDG